MLAKCLAMAVVVLALQQMQPAAFAAEATARTEWQDTANPPQTAPAAPQNPTRPASQPAANSTPRPNPANSTTTGSPSARSAGQANPGNGPARQPATRPAPAESAAPNGPASNAQPDCGGFPCDTPQPRVIAVNPPPTAAPWPLHEKILWAAYIVLALLGYAGIMLALSVLKKIERQTLVAEAAAQTAHDTANAALLSAQALVNAERPWLLVTVEPSLTVENGFTVVATNRGRSPAEIVATAERLRIAADETKLPRQPEYGDREAAPPMVPIILLPGESTALKPFSREDARELCESDEQFARIETWEEKIFLYGRVVYKDLIAAPEMQQHQTNWCCWYIHGRQKSGLVIAGGPEYNSHT
jgi:hypothetical protein